jgi:hypothetical protein
MTLRSAALYCFAHMIQDRLDVAAPDSAFADYLIRRIHDLFWRQVPLARAFVPRAHHFCLLRDRLTTFAGRPDTIPSKCEAQRSSAARFSSA